MTKGDTYVRVVRRFDEQGNTVREVTLDENNRPVARKDGYDEVRNTFDENNRVIRMAMDRKPNPAVRRVRHA